MLLSYKNSFVHNLVLSVICLFMLFAASMTIYLMHREEAHHADLLHVRLQAYNQEVIDMHDSCWHAPHKDVRLTVLDLSGDVLFESTDTIAGQSHKNHIDREEVQMALRDSVGYAVMRSSKTTGKDYFYSATRFGDYIVRSALPYDTQLRKSLASDRHYLYAAILITLVLLGLFLYMTRRLNHSENDKLELETRLQLEQEFNNYKRELSNNIAHELKTPVASIQGYLETILDARQNSSISDEQLSRFLERSYSQSQRLNALVQDISTLNHMSEAQVVEKSPVDVSKLVRDMLDEVALKLELQQMTVCNELPCRLMIEGNQSMIYSIFRNLIDNAIAYAGQGSKILIRLSETPIKDKSGITYAFLFADNGSGIPGEHLARIFERFYRVDKGRSRKLGGTGLGLAIVKNAVLLHGGNITAKNCPTGGLQFDFTLKSSSELI